MNERRRRFVYPGVLIATCWAVLALSSLSGSRLDRLPGRIVIDLAGREVAAPDSVKRLVALGPGALRLVVYLGASDRIVGIEDMERRMERHVYIRPYATALDESFLSLPVVGSGGPGALPDPEKILACRPDLVIVVGLDSGQLDNLQAKIGAPVLCLSYGELGGWREEAQRSLALLGDVFGVEARATALNEYIGSLEDDLKERSAGLEGEGRPSSFFGGISYKGAHGLTSTEAGYPPGRMAGARNLADGLGKTGHFFVDKEQILTWNPDYIFLDIASRSILDQDLERNRDFYRLLDAAQSGRVFSVLAYNYYNTNIELALLNAYFIGQSIYPERFSDVRLEDKAAEIMEAFLDIRLDEEMPAFRPLRFPDIGPIKWK